MKTKIETMTELDTPEILKISIYSRKYFRLLVLNLRRD